MVKIPAWLCVKYEYNRSKRGGGDGECSGWHRYEAASPESERSCNLGSSLGKKCVGGRYLNPVLSCTLAVIQSCCCWNVRGENITAHHLPRYRRRLKLYQTGQTHTCSPGLCQAPADVVQRFAKNPKAKKIFLLLISCSLQRFYFVKKKKKKKKVLWRNPWLHSYRLTSRVLEQSVTFQRCDFVPRCFSHLSFLSNTNKRTM